MEILLTRHGQTEWNILGKVQGRADIELNEKVKLTILTEIELNDAKTLISEKYSIYSDSDHLVPFKLLE